jgi:hypothetical protein
MRRRDIASGMEMVGGVARTAAMVRRTRSWRRIGGRTKARAMRARRMVIVASPWRRNRTMGLRTLSKAMVVMMSAIVEGGRRLMPKSGRLRKSILEFDGELKGNWLSLLLEVSKELMVRRGNRSWMTRMI